MVPCTPSHQFPSLDGSFIRNRHRTRHLHTLPPSSHDQKAASQYSPKDASSRNFLAWRFVSLFPNPLEDFAHQRVQLRGRLRRTPLLRLEIP